MADKFKRADAAERGKPDARGTVVVKVFLRDPKSLAGYALPGNRKEEIVVEDATVGRVYETLETALFGDEREE